MALRMHSRMSSLLSTINQALSCFGKLSRFWPQLKHETSTIMIRLSYYAYIGISSLHHQFVFSKANGLVATAPPCPTWPQLICSINVLNWVDDIYLTLGIITAPIYSRFAESEFDRQHGAHHIAFPCKIPTISKSITPGDYPVGSHLPLEYPLLLLPSILLC
jgi:hypothetical protein